MAEWTGDTQQVVEAVAEDVFEGLPVGVGEEALCAGCHEPIRDGDCVEAYIYSVPGRPKWDMARVFCMACRPGEVASPTLGAAEFVAHARLAVVSDAATQSVHLALRDPEVVDHADPDEGAEP